MHVIRLRGPFDWMETESGSPPLPRVDVHLASLPAELSKARLLRRFGYPTGIEPGDRIFLEAKQVPAGTQLLLQGELLGEVPANGVSRFEVGMKLRPRNTLELLLPPLATVALDSEKPSDGWLQVQLEIVPS